MEQRNDMDMVNEVMLPGFRFHPTDEELVAFYLRRKIQKKTLSIELIRQLDIYKYDPWDLPKLATTGEKEWYFYCPRDRKYRNSTRPNRVTGAGFWKATGTDRPIYSSEGTNCIGLKKSLVFYKGRAAKGVKTDWMMHEYRLPSLTDSSQLPRRPVDKDIPANDSWAICRIFKKTKSTAQRAQVSPSPEAVPRTLCCPQACSENMSCTTEAGPATHFGGNITLQHQHQSPTDDYPSFAATQYEPINLTNSKPSSIPVSSAEIPIAFMLSAPVQALSKCPVDVASPLRRMSPASLENTEKNCMSIAFTQQQQQPLCNSFTTGDLLLDENRNLRGPGEEEVNMKNADAQHVNNNQWETLRTVAFPFSLPSNLSDEWKPSLTWDSGPCSNEIPQPTPPTSVTPELLKGASLVS